MSEGKALMRVQKRNAAAENHILDVFMDGPSSISDVAHEAKMSPETVRRIVKHLQAIGLIESYGLITNGSARPIMFYQMARTRKAA